MFLVIFTKGTVWTMVKMIALKCPECGAKLQIEDGHKECFCQYCGHKILLDDGSVETTYTYRKVDEARIKEAEVDKLIRLKELEIKQKELDRKAERMKQNKAVALRAGVIIGVFGFFLTLIGLLIRNENITLMGVVFLAVVLWLGAMSFIYSFLDDGESDKSKKGDSK